MLTEKQLSFIRNYAQNGNATLSAKMSGYSPNHAEQQGHNLKNQLSNEILVETKKNLQGSVPLAVERIQAIIKDSKAPPAVRLQACNSVLDRSGLGISHTSEIKDITHNKSDAALREELRHVLTTIGVVGARPPEEKDIN